jgi:hypothetical protein
MPAALLNFFFSSSTTVSISMEVNILLLPTTAVVDPARQEHVAQQAVTHMEDHLQGKNVLA